MPRDTKGRYTAMTTLKIKTSGTHCPSCSMLIEMNVGDLDGVANVKADHASAVATVEFDPAVVTTDQILAEIVKAGYGAEVLG